jgi:single-stranded DNA-binding protein
VLNVSTAVDFVAVRLIWCLFRPMDCTHAGISGDGVTGDLRKIREIRVINNGGKLDMASNVRTFCIIEGPIRGEPKIKYTRTNIMVCDIGFPIPTTEQEGLEHKDFWIPTTSFGGLAEILSKLPSGTLVHVEGHFDANQWRAEDGTIKFTNRLILERAGLCPELGKEVKFFVIAKKEKAKAKTVSAGNGNQSLANARAYLQEHEQREHLQTIAQEELGPDVGIDSGSAGPGAADAGAIELPLT